MADIKIQAAKDHHKKFAETISKQYERSAKIRGTGIAKRSPDYIKKQITEGKAVIAVDEENDAVAGFCYIESFGNRQYVANSGLTVFPEYRRRGLAKKIKAEIFNLSREYYPNAKIFGLTTSLAVMKINSDIGYKPVTFSELTDDDVFWKGCQSCVNYEILQSKGRENCLCTGMLFDPEKDENKINEKSKIKGKADEGKKPKKKWDVRRKSKVYERLIRQKIYSFTGKKVKPLLSLITGVL